MDDPREGPNLSDVLVGKDPRDVLADRIQTWADTEDWHVYDYVDRLLADLDAAGYEVTKRQPDTGDPILDDILRVNRENERLSPETGGPMTEAMSAIPDRIGIDANGFGWRAWDDVDFWSMVPTNPDNSPIPEPVTWFVRAGEYIIEGWWHPNVKAGQVHDHPEQPGRGWSEANHRLCEQVYTKRTPVSPVPATTKREDEDG